MLEMFAIPLAISLLFAGGSMAYKGGSTGTPNSNNPTELRSNSGLIVGQREFGGTDFAFAAKHLAIPNSRYRRILSKEPWHAACLEGGYYQCDVEDSILLALSAIAVDQKQHEAGNNDVEAARAYLESEGIKLTVETRKKLRLDSAKQTQFTRNWKAAYVFVPYNAKNGTFHGMSDLFSRKHVDALTYGGKSGRKRFYQELDNQEIRSLRYKECKVRDRFLSMDEKTRYFFSKPDGKVFDINIGEPSYYHLGDPLNAFFTGNNQCETTEYGDLLIAYVRSLTSKPDEVRIVIFKKLIALEAGMIP